MMAYWSPRFRVSVLCLIVALGVLSVAAAAPPWEKMLTLNRVEADPQKSYTLCEENGPWMVMATSFSGEGAEKQAQELVHELRSRYKLPAYTHRMKFEFGKDAPGRGIDQFGNPLKMRYQHGSEVEEIAVLVGDFPAVDSPEAQESLNTVKNSRPECLDVEKRKQTNQSLASWRMIQNELRKAAGKKSQRGPMAHAFVTANPLLPKEYFVPKGIDPLVLKMNERVEHGLLDCPGKYTVQVATFKGESILDQKKIQEALSQGDTARESRLAQAADRAHRLAEALRMKGYDAYEFHDRYSSIVTVGSFSSVGTPRADGKIEINPQILAIMENFKAHPSKIPNVPGALEPRTLVGIPFDIQPMPVEVPKRSVAAAQNPKPADLF